MGLGDVGAMQVEYVIISDTHRSQVQRTSSGRMKEGVMTVQDLRGPGLDVCCVFILFVCAVVCEGLPLYFHFVFILL